MGECAGRWSQRHGRVLREGLPGGHTCVTMNHATFLSQKGPSLQDKLHEHTTLRLVEVMGCQRRVLSREKQGLIW